MCSVPLQLEKILDVLCQQWSGETGGKVDTPLTEEVKTQRRWWKQKGCFQGQSILVGHKGVNLIAPGGIEEREEEMTRKVGGIWESTKQEDLDTKERDGERSVSTVGHWEPQLALNVLQQSLSTENNIGWLINLIIVPCQTPVSMFTSLLCCTPYPTPTPHNLSMQHRTEAR